MAQVDLDPASEAFIRREVESGRYRDRADVVRAGLSRLEDEGNETRLLADLLAESFDDPRPSVPVEAVFERLAHKHAHRRRS